MTRKELLEDYLRREYFKLSCYSLSYSMICPRAGYEKEYHLAQEKIKLLNEMLEEEEDSLKNRFIRAIKKLGDGDEGIRQVMVDICPSRLDLEEDNHCESCRECWDRALSEEVLEDGQA